MSAGVPNKRDVVRAQELAREIPAMSRAEARQTPHEFAPPANPYKSALLCVHCGLLRRHAVHQEQA